MNWSIGSLFSSKACPISAKQCQKRTLGFKCWIPLLGFVVPTLVVGYGVVIPRSCIAGVNELTIGFATTVLGACITYVLGVRSALAQSAE